MHMIYMLQLKDECWLFSIYLDWFNFLILCFSFLERFSLVYKFAQPHCEEIQVDHSILFYSNIFLWWSIFQIAASYFAFLETLFNGHLSFVLKLDKNALMLIVGSLELGIKDLSEKISSQVCENLHIFWLW